ncbi:tetratricopeptide repeat protein [Polyangium aurulentum]|uniref:tetratricopeptide repeat protein n=1 Tax=Polyangium aurulentum TaxID=2567896 RepID=UPI0010AE4A7F|nr:hypothetical protein [Polyangium aurulentum]UQA56754.1 hypothetical protein E8A73_036450 [Polyangium aurulentum]
MNAAERARTAARIAAMPAAPGIGGAIGGTAWIKAIAVAASVGAGGLVVQEVWNGEPPAIMAPAEHLPAERFRALDTQAAPTPARPEETDTAPADAIEIGLDIEKQAAATNPRRWPPRKVVQAPRAPAALDTDALLREAELLEKARTGVARDPEGALRALDGHRASFPAGQLTAEREYLAIDALSRLGRHDEARARAKAFVARFPSSPFAERARRIADTNP